MTKTKEFDTVGLNNKEYMTTIKWETVKLKCQQGMNVEPMSMFNGGFTDYFWTTLLGVSLAEKKNWREVEPELREKCYSIIANWDIRRAKTLIDLFPSMMPKQCLNVIPKAEYDEKGDWVLIFN